MVSAIKINPKIILDMTNNKLNDKVRKSMIKNQMKPQIIQITTMKNKLLLRNNNF
jgi:hypothetical protein